MAAVAELSGARIVGDPATGVLLVGDVSGVGASGTFPGVSRVYVPEIGIHGAFLDVPEDEDDWWKKLVAIEILLIRSASRASIALSWLHSLSEQLGLRLDRQRLENAEDPLDPNSAVWRAAEARRLRDQAIPDNLPPIERTRIARRLAFAEGNLPSEMQSQHAEMYQDMYVFALDGVNRGFMELLKVLRERDQKALVKAAQDEFLAAVGDVTRARHSLHHPEDWLQGRGRGENRRTSTVSPEPIDTPEIRAPQGVMVSMSVDGQRLVVTAGDGSYAEIITSEEALLTVIKTAQQALNAMPRRSMEEIRPHE